MEDNLGVGSAVDAQVSASGMDPLFLSQSLRGWSLETSLSRKHRLSKMPDTQGKSCIYNVFVLSSERNSYLRNSIMVVTSNVTTASIQAQD